MYRLTRVILLTILGLQLMGKALAQNSYSVLNIANLAQPVGIATGDFNHDGKMDMAVTDLATKTVQVFYGDGSGHLAFSKSMPTGVGPFAVCTSDVDGDGNLDIIVANTTDKTLNIFYGRRDGSFQRPKTIALPGYPSAIVAADVNGDGRPDLLVTLQGTNQ